MLPTTILAALLTALPLAAAGPVHGNGNAVAHGHLARAPAAGTGAGLRQRGSRRRRGQQCRPRPKPEGENNQLEVIPPTPESEDKPEGQPQDQGQQQQGDHQQGGQQLGGQQQGGQQQGGQQQGGDQNQGGEWKPEPTPPTDQNPEPTKPPQNNGGFITGNGPCGEPQPDANSPNGQRWWLECGLDGGGWNPPHLTFDQIKTVELTGAPPYDQCTQFFDKFYEYGARHGIPAIVLAAIAQQESTCEPKKQGGAGEQGLMQLFGINCDGAPGGDCMDVDFNINRGAEYLRNRIDLHGGSVLLGLGAYNGWSQGMTKATVDGIAWKDGCFAQPNMDYMDQMLNGWLQGKQGWERGFWHNRAHCGK